mmetsp:Transcript_83271/g.257385  ORF Transcript_83271/g.257385 Transcript_83271/m.257385 type:complete len:239 (-) Transcript_83271:371-1087(-)
MWPKLRMRWRRRQPRRIWMTLSRSFIPAGHPRWLSAGSGALPRRSGGHGHLFRRLHRRPTTLTGHRDEVLRFITITPHGDGVAHPQLAVIHLGCLGTLRMAAEVRAATPAETTATQAGLGGGRRRGAPRPDNPLRGGPRRAGPLHGSAAGARSRTGASARWGSSTTTTAAAMSRGNRRERRAADQRSSGPRTTWAGPSGYPSSLLRRTCGGRAHSTGASRILFGTTSWTARSPGSCLT